jgi:hypothetical protein
MLAEHSISPSVARYEAGEHAQFGSGKEVVVNTVKMTESDLVAMGDLYENPSDMKSADPAELTKLRDLIRRDRAAFEHKNDKDRVTDAEWEQATAGRVKLKKKTYLDLAASNDTHFAAPAAGGTAAGDNKSEWEKYHRQALDASHANAATSKDVPQEAIILNGFAAHFLTDAFSAGHLVAKTDVMAEARQFWDKAGKSGLIFKETALTKGVAKLVLADPTASKTLAGQELKLVAWGDVTEERFSELIFQLSEKEPDKFFNLFAKIVHDKLNQSIGSGPAGGVEVDNAKGEKPWLLSGDTTLAASPTTLRVAQAAVRQSNKNLEDAAKTSGPLAYADLFKQVWDFTPRPTAAGKTNIQTLIATFANADDKQTIAAFAALTIAQLPTAIQELTKRGNMRPKPAPAASGGGTGGGSGAGGSSDAGVPGGGGPTDAGVPGGTGSSDAGASLPGGR